jgi:hypothetical protein
MEGAGRIRGGVVNLMHPHMLCMSLCLLQKGEWWCWGACCCSDHKGVGCNK